MSRRGGKAVAAGMPLLPGGWVMWRTRQPSHVGRRDILVPTRGQGDRGRDAAPTISKVFAGLVRQSCFSSEGGRDVGLHAERVQAAQPVYERFRIHNIIRGCDWLMKIRSTTVIAVRRGGETALAGDGQVSIEDTIFKSTATKLRTMRDGKILAGYAGAAADAMALFERLETKLDEYSGNLQRAVVELAKEWRTDKVLRQLQALMIVSDKDNLMLVSGTGDIIVPDGDLIGVGSGGGYAQAAAQAMLKYTDMSAAEIAEEAVRIAAGICVYTNENITVEVVK